MRTAVILVLTRLFVIGYNYDGAVIHASIGDTITLKCPLLSLHLSDVQWTHIESKTVYSDGFNINPTIFRKAGRGKFEIVGNHDIGEFNLKISNLEMDDSGIYRCDSDINGKPESIFVNLVLYNSQTVIGNGSNEYTTDIYNQKTREFSIYKWIIIFVFSILGILILPVLVAGAFKTFRSSRIESHTGSTSESLYDTISDIPVTNPHALALPRSNINVSVLPVHQYGPERHSAHVSLTTMLSLCNALQSPLGQQNAFFSNSLHNENNKDSNSVTSSTESFGTSLGLVNEVPYINHYHPLGSSCERESHVYDEC